MAVLYVTSSGAAVGKTAICAGIGSYLLKKGKKVGFFKPFIGDKTIDGDCVFMKKILAMDEPEDSLCPAISDQENMGSDIEKAYAKISADKDVVIVEGVSDQGQAGQRITQALNARVIVAGDYSDKENIISSAKGFGKSLLGVVLNKVPASKLEQVRQEISARAGEAGVSVLGVLPEDRVLYSLTIGELAEQLQGEILNFAGESDELVENFMLGAMCVDPGPDYYGRKASKAVVLKSERPDMQMAVLETPTKCLVVTGDTELFHGVLYGAETRNVPIISVKGDTVSTIASIEDALSQTRFHQEKKLKWLDELMEKHFDFQAIS